MSKRIQLIFTKLDNPILDLAVIAITEGQRFAGHVALAFPDENYYGPFMIEAVPPKLTVQRPEYYDDEENKFVMEIEVTDAQYVIAIEKALAYYREGSQYGFVDCLVGGLTELLSQEAGDRMADALSCSENEMDCSEFATRVLREIFPFLLTGIRPDTVVPERLWENIIALNAQNQIKIIRWFYGKGN